MANKQISKVTLGGVTYDIKDEAARARLTALEGIASGGVSIKVVEELPTPGDDTLGIIYFKKKTPAGKEGDIFDEYLTVKVTEGSQEVAKWEHIGSTSVDLSEYAKKVHHHDVKLEVEYPVYKVEPQEDPIELPVSKAYVTPSTMDNIARISIDGEPYTLEGGGLNKQLDTFEYFTTEGIKATYNDSDETLVFSDARTAQGIAEIGEVSVTFPHLNGRLPSFEKHTVLTSVEVSNSYQGKAAFKNTVRALPVKKRNILSGVTVYGAKDGEGIFVSSENHL